VVNYITKYVYTFKHYLQILSVPECFTLLCSELYTGNLSLIYVCIMIQILLMFKF